VYGDARGGHLPELSRAAAMIPVPVRVQNQRQISWGNAVPSQGLDDGGEVCRSAGVDEDRSRTLEQEYVANRQRNGDQHGGVLTVSRRPSNARVNTGVKIG
jgi:hypothetical protein